MSTMPPPSPSPHHAQHASQFVTTLLSHRGGDHALPYAEDDKWLIRHHLLALLDAFPSLPPAASPFFHNDGRSLRLLRAEGTFPIHFAGATYHVPAAIWLTEAYPHSPPAVFLTPTRDMVVRHGHPFVDRSGHVTVPYLSAWAFPTSNLVDLVRSISTLFGQDPPLYTRQPPPANPSRPDFPNPKPSPSPSSSSPRPTLPSTAPSSASPYRMTEEAADAFRDNAVSRIVEAACAGIAAARRLTEAEMENLFAAQAELRRRGEALDLGLREMREEKEVLEQQLQLLVLDAGVLEGWVRENAGKNGSVFDVDDALEPFDAMSGQLLECTAADMAMEDALYVLDRALREGAIPFDLYFRNVRALARDQFFQRATSAKVRAAQVQLRITDMAARASQYTV